MTAQGEYNICWILVVRIVSPLPHSTPQASLAWPQTLQAQIFVIGYARDDDCTSWDE